MSDVHPTKIVGYINTQPFKDRFQRLVDALKFGVVDPSQIASLKRQRRFLVERVKELEQEVARLREVESVNRTLQQVIQGQEFESQLNRAIIAKLKKEVKP
jgi:uncharacterized protein YigA (DUF484 family)